MMECIYVPFMIVYDIFIFFFLIKKQINSSVFQVSRTILIL